MLEVFFPTLIEQEDGETTKIVRYEICAMIGPVEHNLLSVHGLTRAGATFSFGPDRCTIHITDTRRMDCEIWDKNVPCARAHRKRCGDLRGHRNRTGSDFGVTVLVRQQSVESRVKESIKGIVIRAIERSDVSAIEFAHCSNMSHAKAL